MARREFVPAATLIDTCLRFVAYAKPHVREATASSSGGPAARATSRHPVGGEAKVVRPSLRTKGTASGTVHAKPVSATTAHPPAKGQAADTLRHRTTRQP